MKLYNILSKTGEGAADVCNKVALAAKKTYIEYNRESIMEIEKIKKSKKKDYDEFSRKSDIVEVRMMQIMFFPGDCLRYFIDNIVKVFKQ